MPGLAKRANQRFPQSGFLNGDVRLHERQRRSLELACQLIEHTIQSCNLALEMERMTWIWRCETRSRRLCGRIALFWSWNLPEEHREELQFHSHRLKEAIRRLQRFREAADGELRVPPDSKNSRVLKTHTPTKYGAVIEFPRNHKPSRHVSRAHSDDEMR